MGAKPMNETLFQRGLVHIYIGDGKGKTTAALGVGLRVLGWGGRVCMVQFIKGYSDIGEAHFAAAFPDRFELRQFALDVSRAIGEAKVRERREAAREALEWAKGVIDSGENDLVILDEINVALRYGLIQSSDVLAIIQNRPPHVELILTGRGAPPELMEAADYVTEMRPIKHPYEQGIPARKGIDY